MARHDLIEEATLRTSRSSGPGGQHANVTASRVEAIFDVDASTLLTASEKERIKSRLGTRVTAVAQDSRSQTRNRELALERLRERLENALRVQRRRTKTKPTRSARLRRMEGKRRQGERKKLRRPPTDQ